MRFRKLIAATVLAAALMLTGAAENLSRTKILTGSSMPRSTTLMARC